MLTQKSAAALQEESSPLADQIWVRLGGPLGGIGYNIKMGPTNPDVMYVTDAFSGIHKSIDGGKTWYPINNGIDIRAGESVASLPFWQTDVPDIYFEYDTIYKTSLFRKNPELLPDNMTECCPGFSL